MKVETIDKYPQLNLPQCTLSTRAQGNAREVWDVARRAWVRLTPEEWVRQHVIHAFAETLGYPVELMQVEGTITLNEMSRRCDIVIYGNATTPRMIVECKKPQVSLTQKVIDQACRYNMVLNVPYLYLTNGMQHLVLKVDKNNHTLNQIQGFPSWEEIKA